jgi:hypothetical protein
MAAREAVVGGEELQAAHPQPGERDVPADEVPERRIDALFDLPLLRRLRGLVAVATQVGCDPTDSSEERLRKGLLVTICFMVLPAGLLWGLLYWLFDERTAALFPWGYVVASAAALAVFTVTHSFRFLRTAELLLILVAPALLLVALGGLRRGEGT